MLDSTPLHRVSRAIWQGLWLGVAFGLAASVLDAGFSGFGTIFRRFGPGPAFLFPTALLEIGLGALLGLALAPLCAVGRRLGTLLHVAALALAWIGLGRLVEFDAPLARPLLLGVPLGSAGLVGLGVALAQLRVWLPWGLGGALLLAAIFVPQAYVDATSAPTAPRAARPAAPAGAPDVVVIVLDTVRADHLSSYGYARATSPAFDAIAREGALFEDATSPSTWSLPSHASLFTGRFPTSHGAHGEHLVLDERFPTLAAVLAASGWETFCFTSNAWISDGLGLSRGFDYQDASWREEAGAGRNFSFMWRLLDWLGLVEGDKGGATVAANFASWVAERPEDAPPFFAFLNFIEAHFPYHQLPHAYLTRFTERPRSELLEISMGLMAQQFGGPIVDLDQIGSSALDMYDGGIVYTDELLRRVTDALRARGTLDQTILVVLGDHGETLGERAGFFGHGPSLYQEVIGVPLLVRFPPRVPAGTRVPTPVSTVGVFATVAGLVGIEAPSTLQVPSLVPLATGESAGAGPVIAELTQATALGGGGRSRDDPQMQGGRRYRAWRDGSWKLVVTSKGEHFLFDLSSDPDEQRDLAPDRPVELARLTAGLEAARVALELPDLDADLAAASGVELDPATRERLRQLGYVE